MVVPKLFLLPILSSPLSLNVVIECCMKSLRPAFCWKWTYQSVLRATTATTTTTMQLFITYLVAFRVLAGRRACLGESLARMTSFLLLAGLTSKLRFSLPDGHPDIDTEGLTGFTLGPPKFLVKIQGR